MNGRLFLILAVVVAIIGGGAYYFTQERESLQATAFEKGPMFEGIEAKINNVDTFRIESQEGGVLTLVRKDEQWVIQEHYGYPADNLRVTGILKRIATLEKIEPKTKKPENYKRLSVGDPSDEFSLATRLTLKAGETMVADFVAGLNRPPAMGGGVFLREFDDAQTWLAEGEFKPKRRVLDWLQRTIIDIDGRRISGARIQHPALDKDGKPMGDGATADLILVAKETPDQEKYSLGAAIPDGYKPKPDHELSAIARIPDFLILEGVKPAGEVDMVGASTTLYETYDGIRMTFTSKKQADGKTWTTIAVTAAERWQGLDAFLEAYKGKDSEAGRIADEFKSPKDVAAEIKKWSAATDGWAYNLTDYKSKRLTARTPDVIAAPDAKQGQPKQ